MKEFSEYLKKYCGVCDTPYDRRYKTRTVFGDSWRWCTKCEDMIQVGEVNC